MDDAGKNHQIEFESFAKKEKPSYAYLKDIRQGAASENAPISVVFSHQSVIVLVVCVLMSLVVSFALGVEKGKLVARNTPGAEQLAAAAETHGPQAQTALPVISQNPGPTAPERPAQTKTADAPPATLQETPTALAAAKETSGAASMGYAVQIASVKSTAAAKLLTETLIKKGVPSFSKTSGKYIVVLAGNFSKREEAQTSLKELKKTYSDCFIKKI